MYSNQNPCSSAFICGLTCFSKTTSESLVASNLNVLWQFHVFVTCYVVFEVFALHTVFPSGSDKRREQRVCRKRFRFIFGMKLARHKVWMLLTRQFDHLDKFAVRRNAADDQPFFFEHAAKFRVKFIAVSVPLRYLRHVVIYLANEASLL